MNRLKPCPFCGGEAMVVNTGRGVFAVGCNNVRCRGDWVTAKCSWDENIAIEAWNTRAEKNADRAYWCMVLGVEDDED